MSKILVNPVQKKFIFILVLLIMSIFLNAEIFHNWGECQFEPGCAPDGGSSEGLYTATAESGDIGLLIVLGAGHVYNANSGIATYLNRIEMASLFQADTTEQREIIYKVIIEMEMAKAVFEELNAAAAVTPYKKEKIDILTVFDYEGFREKWGMNPIVFKPLHEYLVRGDVRGVFSRMLKDTEAILDQLYELKAILDSYKTPEIQTAWKLNQSFSDYILFGQYAAMIFNETK